MNEHSLSCPVCGGESISNGNSVWCMKSPCEWNEPVSYLLKSLIGQKAGGWVTIEGTHVHLDSEGEIDKGPPKLEGKKPDDLPPRPEHPKVKPSPLKNPETTNSEVAKPIKLGNRKPISERAAMAAKPRDEWTDNDVKHMIPPITEGELNMCFENARKEYLALKADGKNPKYCVGTLTAYKRGLPPAAGPLVIDHAWVEVDGKVVDPSPFRKKRIGDSDNSLEPAKDHWDDALYVAKHYGKENELNTPLDDFPSGTPAEDVIEEMKDPFPERPGSLQTSKLLSVGEIPSGRKSVDPERSESVPEGEDDLEEKASLIADILGMKLSPEEIDQILGGKKSFALYPAKAMVEKKDKRGYRMCYDDETGSRVPCTPKQGTTPKLPKVKPSPFKPEPKPTPQQASAEKPNKVEKPKTERGPKAKKGAQTAEQIKPILDGMRNGPLDDTKINQIATMLGGMKVTELKKLHQSLGAIKPPARKAELVEKIKQKLIADGATQKPEEVKPPEPVETPKEPEKPIEQEKPKDKIDEIGKKVPDGVNQDLADDVRGGLKTTDELEKLSEQLEMSDDAGDNKKAAEVDRTLEFLENPEGYKPTREPVPNPPIAKPSPVKPEKATEEKNTVKHITKPEQSKTYNSWLDGENADRWLTKARDDGFSGEDEFMKDMNRELGYDNPPEVIDEEDMDKLIAGGSLELFRGLSDVGDKKGEDLCKMFRDGDFYAGIGVYGNGTYAAKAWTMEEGNGYNYALQYTQHSRVGSTSKTNPEAMMRMCMKKGAKVCTEDGLVNLKREQQKEVDNLIKQTESETDGGKKKQLQRKLGIISDTGRYAALHGWDAIDDRHFVIINRAACIVQGTPPKPSTNQRNIEPPRDEDEDITL